MSEKDNAHSEAHGGGSGGGRRHGPPPSGGGHEESSGESAPLWVISFADLSTLLMSFFVLMMCSTPKGVTSKTPDAELLKVLASIKAAFRYKPNPTSLEPMDIAVMKVIRSKEEWKDPDGGRWYKGAGIKGTSPPVNDLWNKAQTSIGEPIPFARRSATVPPEWRWLIEAVAEIVRDHYRVIIIRGHVSADEALEEGDGGFDLAYRRALALKRALVELGIAPARFRLLSCGPHEPAVFEAAVVGSQKGEPEAIHRRAEITLGAHFMPDTVSDEGDLDTDESADMKRQ